MAEVRTAFNVFVGRDAAPESLNRAVNGADLQVSGLAVGAAGPVRAGQDVTVTWTTRNGGVANAAGGTVERLIVRNADNFVIAVVDVPGGAALAAGAERARSVTLRLPSGAAGTGALRFTVLADVANAAPEPNGKEGARTSLTVTALPDTLPDLVIENITVSPGANWKPGDPVRVSWVTRNAGLAAVNGSFTEQIRIRNTITNTEVALTPLEYNGGPLAAGATVARSLVIAWPGGRGATGTYAVTVTTDVGTTIPETNEAGTGETNNATTAQVVSAPDLVVENLRVL